jgi:predicted PurR-regulated permease PerM
MLGGEREPEAKECPMNDSIPAHPDRTMRQAVEISIRLIAIAIFVAWSFRILLPFVNPIVSGAVIAAAIYPLFLKLSGWLGGRRKLAIAVIVLLGLALIIVPVVLMTSSTLKTAHAVGTRVAEGTLEVPPPPAKVQDWPVVGDRLHDAWREASDNLGAFVKEHEPQLKEIGGKVVAMAAGAGAGALHLILAIVIAAIFLANADACIGGLTRFANRMAGAGRGDLVIALSASTVRSVAVGVLGVAFIQAVLATVGMLFAGVPAAGIWALLVLLLAIVQLPPLIVLLPVALWVFGTSDSQVVAWIFLVYALIVSFSDMFLKPLLLGRGVSVPMLVILLGAIGGMILSGIMGLFIGAVVLALGYRLLTTWLEMEKADAV